MSEELKPSCALFLPKRKPWGALGQATQFKAEGWNACLDEVAHLNPADARLVPVELLERIVEHLEYDAIGSPSEALAADLAKELRALLAQSESEGVEP